MMMGLVQNESRYCGGSFSHASCKGVPLGQSETASALQHAGLKRKVNVGKSNLIFNMERVRLNLTNGEFKVN